MGIRDRSHDGLSKVKGSPWEPIPGREDIELKTSVHIDTGDKVHEPMEGMDRPVIKRRFKIKKDDVRTHGMTPGCKGCIALNRGAQAVNHSETCRTRMRTALEDHGDERVIKASDRVEDDLTEELMAEDKR